MKWGLWFNHTETIQALDHDIHEDEQEIITTLSKLIREHKNAGKPLGQLEEYLRQAQGLVLDEAIWDM